jgi:hypothetical protein
MLFMDCLVTKLPELLGSGLKIKVEHDLSKGFVRIDCIFCGIR